MAQEVKLASLDIRNIYACVFRPVESTMHMLFKQNSPKIMVTFINLRQWKKRSLRRATLTSVFSLEQCFHNW